MVNMNIILGASSFLSLYSLFTRCTSALMQFGVERCYEREEQNVMMTTTFVVKLLTHSSLAYTNKLYIKTYFHTIDMHACTQFDERAIESSIDLFRLV